MYKATDGKVLPTTVIGSLPRPAWYTENLGTRNFREAMVNARFREQYTDAVSAYLRDQETAGLDICTDGDCRFDTDVGGHSWFFYAPSHMDGFEGARAYRTEGGRAGMISPRGHILHDVLEARIMPTSSGPSGAAGWSTRRFWKTAQRLTPRPVKFGTITAELIAMAVQDFHYKDLRDSIMAISDALNEELTELAEAGCPAIQMEEPQIHLLAAKGLTDDVLNPEFMVEVFNNTVKGLRDKTEIWCHTCWGNPAQQRIVAANPSYKPRWTRSTVWMPISSPSNAAARAAPTSTRSGSTSRTARSPSVSSTTIRFRSKRRKRWLPRSARRWSTFRRSGWCWRRTAAWGGGHEPPPRLPQDGLDRPRRQHRSPRARAEEATCLAADERYSLVEDS